MALTNKLAAIGAAIRSKTGKTDLLTLDDMVSEIENIKTGGGEGGTDFSSYFLKGGALQTILAQSSTIESHEANEAITNAFLDWLDTKEDVHIYNIETMPPYAFYSVYTPNIIRKFHFHIKDNKIFNISSICFDCYSIECPKLYGSFLVDSSSGISASLYATTQTIEEMYQNVTFVSDSWVLNPSGTGTKNCSYVYQSQYNMTRIPSFDSYLWGHNDGYGSRFRNCYLIKNIILPVYPNALTSNAFTYTFYYTYNLRKLIFEECEAAQWKNQTIDLTINLYHTYKTTSFYDASKEINSATSYEQLKNDEFAWSTNYQYDLYNHDAAVETINSLPDTSAYLAANGGTNTIKFTGNRGKLTTGGAINTLTADEIAVAAAKGWTVTIA